MLLHGFDHRLGRVVVTNKLKQLLRFGIRNVLGDEGTAFRGQLIIVDQVVPDRASAGDHHVRCGQLAFDITAVAGELQTDFHLVGVADHSQPLGIKGYRAQQPPQYQGVEIKAIGLFPGHQCRQPGVRIQRRAR